MSGSVTVSAGVADRPNKDFEADLIRFRALVAQIFGRHRSSQIYRGATITMKAAVCRKLSPRSVMVDIHKELLASYERLEA